MKVLWLSHFSPFPPKGGAQQRAYNMLVQAASEHNIDFISLASHALLEEKFQTVKQGLKVTNEALSKHVNVKALVVFGGADYAKNKIRCALQALFSAKTYDEVYYNHPEFVRAIESAIELEKYDAVYVDTISLMPLLKGITTPVILNHHNIESLMLVRRAEQEGNILKKFLFRWEAIKMKWLEKRYADKVTVNVTCSKLDSERLNSIVPCNTHCIPNGVDTNYFKRKQEYKPENTSGLVFIGDLTWYPNVDAVSWLATDIYPAIEQALGGVDLNVIGKGSVPALDELAGKRANVTAHGFVDDIFPFMENAAAYVCPIRDGGGTKLKVLDALAMGIPLIAHPIACEGIDVEDGVNVLFARTPMEFATKLKLLLADKNLSESLSVEGQKLIEYKYSYSKIGKVFNLVIASTQSTNFN
ncbi:glycosyltransferase family 4 protein [Reinekea marinisedimentorum]|uniref:Glycosyltransferase involved in cell wall biosynthesis n=1 Tax=Reinekea marinisedimentorum TaxID=230495 RepID=A0A4R3ID37_9GAMM|nr:glycosyltransferase family 4 protein [Reinekea marinisedimentorum]TCS44115.1 glycosyltransferase involved in cell wall biosynthesis [Reinekea marinisedimentorum]